MSFTFAIGDIHGCLTQMEAMLRWIEPYGRGTVIFLGDYVDRGPNSRGVVERLIAGPKSPEWKWIALKGNHEDMMVGAMEGRYEESWWLASGGIETVQSYGGLIPQAHLDWADRLPLIHSDQYRMFVHAGVKDGVYLEDQTPHDLMWTRFTPSDSNEFWGKHLVHGHTPSAHNPRTIGNRTNVDSACVFDGRLSCAVFDDDVPGAPIEFIEVKT
ncbi:metallophosphoesterase family protein [Rhizobium sp. LjRoot258]|uniref:metallophosphoesterase family protein n=1 Tax=Rhizobium sp. LjRoot258 TaxID=3342299 RepID=UPI003ED1341E